MESAPPAAAPRVHPVASWLRNRPPLLVAVWAMTAAFTAYGCMYAFRKPFSAAAYQGSFFGVDYKVLLVLAQIMGYTVSKFLGIKFVSEAPPGRRVGMVLLLIGVAEAALLLFAVTPAPWNGLWMFVNGLPLGMVWGLIFSFLEGRRVTEVMALGLSLSLIFASGWVKAAGLLVMNVMGVSAYWMPAVTGALFLPPLLLALWMLAVLPPPDAADVAARMRRVPMDRDARRAFMARHSPGVVLLIAGYMMLMTYRDVRDTFQVDILRELGVSAGAGQLAGIETAVGIAVILVLGLMSLIKNNRAALIVCWSVIALGGVITGVATPLLETGRISPQAWMMMTGIGLYAAFIPYQAVLFERLFAALRVTGTAAFLISMCDSYGYLSTVTLYMLKAFGGASDSWLWLLKIGGYALGVGLPLLLLAAAAVTLRGLRRGRPAPAATSPAMPGVSAP